MFDFVGILLPKRRLAHFRVRTRPRERQLQIRFDLVAGVKDNGPCSRHETSAGAKDPAMAPIGHGHFPRRDAIAIDHRSGIVTFDGAKEEFDLLPCPAATTSILLDFGNHHLRVMDLSQSQRFDVWELDVCTKGVGEEVRLPDSTDAVLSLGVP